MGPASKVNGKSNATLLIDSYGKYIYPVLRSPSLLTSVVY